MMNIAGGGAAEERRTELAASGRRERGAMGAQLVVSVHDVAPASAQATATWLAELDKRDIRASLLVIPGRWRGAQLGTHAEYAAFLRERRTKGDEIVQHGWRHEAGADGCGWRALAQRGLARGAGEFAALSSGAATMRIRAGMAVMREHDLSTTAFTAPGWLHSPGTLVALRELGFSHTTTHTGLVDLRSGTVRRGIALSHRPGGAGERAAARIMRMGARAAARNGGLVRIALHPDDLLRPGLRGATLHAIDDALSLGAVPTTYARLLAAVAA